MKDFRVDLTRGVDRLALRQGLLDIARLALGRSRHGPPSADSRSIRWLSRRKAQGQRALRGRLGCPAARAARLSLALQPNCAWYQRERALGAEKPSSIATSVNGRLLSMT